MKRRCILSTCAIVVATAIPAWAGGDPVSPAASVAAYRRYATTQAELLARMIRVFSTDIRDGNLEAACNDYAMTRSYLERIRPLLATQADLARRMDADAGDYPEKDRDPGFTGFHRIEQGLFARHSTEGLGATVERLYDDAAKLREALATQPMAIDMLLDAPAAVMERASAQAFGGGREPYARTDLWDIEANVEGAQEIVAAIRPQVAARDPLLLPRIDAAFEATRERLSALRDGCGFKTFDALTAAEKADLRETTGALARELAKLRAASLRRA